MVSGWGGFVSDRPPGMTLGGDPMSQDDQAPHPDPNAAPATEEPREPANAQHRGDFAEGPTKTHVDVGTLMGDFGAGQEDTPRLGTVQPRGDFASGEEKEPVDPTALRGDFARGNEDKPRK
jgi:hypothetical protein